jgi:hypothetical protein
MQITENLVVDDFFLLEGLVPILSKTVGVRIYDYPFRNFFATQSVLYPPAQPTVARIGAFADYPATYAALQKEGITLIHTPEEHNRCSLLPHWYPLLKDLTPRSIVYDSLPTTKTIEKDFLWPIFVKGERQTNKHRKALSIIENAAQFEELRATWGQNTMLHWQKMVCREYVPLQLVAPSVGDKLPSSYEFRLFYWKQQLVGSGSYWYEARPYALTAQEKAEVLALANEVARRMSVCFLAVDVAKTTAGKWILIEVNDGQESGYAGNLPQTLWENICTIEKNVR